MSILVKIVIGCLIAIGIVAAVLGSAFYVFIRRMINEGSAQATPLTIHMHEDLAPDWLESKDAQGFIKEFERLGFTIGKPYNIEELEQVQLCSLFHPEYCGVIYNISGMGYFYDVVHETTSGEVFAITSSPFAEVFDAQPGVRKVVLKNSRPSDGFNHIAVKCSVLEAKVFNNENFRDSLESFYKQEQAFQNRNGGISFDQFQEIAKLDPKKHSEQHIKERYIEFKTDELENWSIAAVEEYLKINDIPAEEQYGEGCYFLIPKKTDPRALIHFLAWHDLINEEDAETVANASSEKTNIIELFDQINASRSAELRAREKGDITFPVEGKIYQLAA